MSPQTILTAYIISNIVGLVMLLAAWKQPGIGRLMYWLLFGWAAWFNAKMALTDPQIYLGYAAYAIEPYRQLILGAFADHPGFYVLLIALGQLAITVGLLAPGTLHRLGCIGGIIFLVAIAPLGVASAFPATLIMAGGLLMLYRRPMRHWLWQEFMLGRGLA